jgi:hypothetical protein
MCVTLLPSGTFTFVSKGVMMSIAAADDADDSIYKVVVDPGITDGSLIQLTPNTSGSTRWDIFECSIGDTVLETDTRDFYDESVDTFYSQSCLKVRAYRCTYRLRVGTPGGGIPALAAGWLPLMMAQVPNGAATWSACACWDVRPLMSDFSHGTMQVRNIFQNDRRSLASMLYGGNMSGYAIANYNSMEVGGELTTGTSYINVTSATYQEASFATTANAPWYLYAVFPKGLPRWLKYQPSTGIPAVGCRGVPIVSRIKPYVDSGAPQSAIAMPTWFSDGTTVTTAAMLFAGMSIAAANFAEVILMDGTGTYQSGTNFDQCPAAINAASSSTTSATYNLTEGTNYPAGAKALHLVFHVTSDSAPATSVVLAQIKAYDLTGTYTAFTHRQNYTNVNGAVTSVEYRVRVPIHAPSSSAIVRVFDFLYTVPAALVGTPWVRLIGWEM